MNSDDFLLQQALAGSHRAQPHQGGLATTNRLWRKGEPAGTATREQRRRGAVNLSLALSRWLLAVPVPVLALTTPSVLECRVDGSDDRFLFYPEQRIYQSGEHWVFSLMGARTLGVVHRATLRFNRLTSLNIQAVPDRLQLFSGQCRWLALQLPESPAPD